MPSSESPTVDIVSVTAADYRLALLAVRDSRTTKPATWTMWVNLLRCHHRLPNHSATSSDLAAAVKLKSASSAHLNYSKLAKAVAEQIGYCPPEREFGKREPMWWMTLSTGSEGADERDPQFKFTMRPELAETLELMQWVQPHDTQG